MSRPAIRRALAVALLVVALLLWPGFQIPSEAAPVVTVSKASGLWTSTATWSCSCIPTSAYIVTILPGHIVTVAGTATSGKVIVQGTLQASRTASSTLTVYGNLVVEGNGVLDYGTGLSPIPSTVTHRIRFVLNEANYVGGPVMTPLDTDVGLWVVGNGKVTTRGPYRDGWSLLTTSAKVGATQITVDSRYASGWAVGDQVAIGPTNAGSAISPGDELRTITVVLGGGKFQLSASLSLDHSVQTVTWDDAWDRSWTETLAPPVANLTRNIIFEAADPNHRPHFLIMNNGVAQLEDLAIVAFSPNSKDLGSFANGRKKPFARYALHWHGVKAGGKNSYAKRVVIRDGQGNGLQIHDTYDLVVEDTVVYNQARSNNTIYHPVFFEGALDANGIVIPDTGANNAWVDRLLVMRWGQSGSGLQRSSGIWIEGGVGAYIVGGHFAGSTGSLSAGIHYQNCPGCENGRSANPTNPDRLPRVWRATMHSTENGFSTWQNPGAAQDVIDLLLWNNRRGIHAGAYHTTRKYFGVRAIGNTGTQLIHNANHVSVTDFLADGQNKGGTGIVMGDSPLVPVADAVYEMGLVRGVATAVDFADCLQLIAGGCGSAAGWSQFSRIEFSGNPLVSFVWHPNIGTRTRFREQTGLVRPANFTLFRIDATVTASPGTTVVTDGVYTAKRLDNDTTGAVAKPPAVRMVYGVSYPGCAADDALINGTATLCAETDAPTVEFWAGKTKVATVTPVAGFAQASLNLSTWPYTRAYVVAKALGSNGRYTYSRVIRVRKQAAGI